MFIERLKDLLKEKGITNTKFCEDIQINKNQIRRWEVTGLTQAEFAKKFHIPKRSIENWESGKRKCPEYVNYLLQQLIVKQ